MIDGYAESFSCIECGEQGRHLPECSQRGRSPVTPECKLAMNGWRCSRFAGHQGPCAATPVFDITSSTVRSRQFTVEETEAIGRLFEEAVNGPDKVGAKERLNKIFKSRGYVLRFV